MKRLVSLFLTFALIISFVPFAFAVSDEASQAAQALYNLGLFQGTGNNADGTPNFDLDRTPTRAESVTMLVRLLGKDEEAKAGVWETPFTDVDDWAKPYVGYAYTNGLTSGTSKTTFGGTQTIDASQYLTFVLRALGYTSGTDFQWDKPWDLSNQIGLTQGQYDASASTFVRGDVAIISFNALSATLNSTEKKFQEIDSQEAQVTLYAPDGRTIEVPQNMVEANKAVGWYEKPVTTLYASDGRTQVFFTDQVEAQLTVGWYKSKEDALKEIKLRIIDSYISGLECEKEAAQYLLSASQHIANGQTSKTIGADVEKAQLCLNTALNFYTSAVAECSDYDETEYAKWALQKICDILTQVTASKVSTYSSTDELIAWMLHHVELTTDVTFKLIKIDLQYEINKWSENVK